MEDTCSKQGCGEKVVLKCLCPQKLKFCMDHITSHLIAEIKNQCSWIDICSEKGCAEQAKARFLISKESKFCPNHLLFHLFAGTKMVKSSKKEKKISNKNLSAEEKTYLINKKILVEFCSLISNELLTIEKDISMNYKRDRNYRKYDKVKILEKVKKMQSELPLEMMGFENISCDSKNFVEKGFTKFLCKIVSTLQRPFPVNATLCKTLTIQLPQMLRTARSIKDANLSLYYIEVLLTLTDLPEKLLESPDNHYITFHGEILNKEIIPFDNYICERVLNLFSMRYICDAFNYLVPSGKSLNALLSTALTKSFITSLAYRVHGITMLNLTILIQNDSVPDEETAEKCKRHKLPKYHNQNKIESILRKKKITAIGYRIIVFLHELAHFIQRSECGTFGEVDNFDSPNVSPPALLQQTAPVSVSSFKDSGEEKIEPLMEKEVSVELPKKRPKTSSDLIKKQPKIKEEKGIEENKTKKSAKKNKKKSTKKKIIRKKPPLDTGYRIEQILFGDIVLFLNYKTANFLLSGNLPLTIDEFKLKFNELNEIEHPIKSLNLRRSTENIMGIMELGECKKAKSLSLFEGTL